MTDHVSEAMRLAKKAEEDADRAVDHRDSDRVRAVAGQIHALLALVEQVKRIHDETWHERAALSSMVEDLVVQVKRVADALGNWPVQMPLYGGASFIYPQAPMKCSRCGSVLSLGDTHVC